MTQFQGFDPGGSPGPWIDWHPQPSKDGQLAAGSWAYRDDDGRRPIDLSRGFVFAWETLRTGWSYTSGAKGIAPQWRWNATTARVDPSPGPDWKKGFQVSVALAPDSTAIWEQAGYAAWQGLCDIMALILPDMQGQLPALPMLAWNGTRAERTSRGPTVIPTFRLVEWVPRPSCLAAPAVTFSDGRQEAASTPSGHAHSGHAALPSHPPPPPPGWNAPPPLAAPSGGAWGAPSGHTPPPPPPAPGRDGPPPHHRGTGGLDDVIPF